MISRVFLHTWLVFFNLFRPRSPTKRKFGEFLSRIWQLKYQLEEGFKISWKDTKILFLDHSADEFIAFMTDLPDAYALHAGGPVHSLRQVARIAYYAIPAFRYLA
jgi:hypothetical protein